MKAILIHNLHRSNLNSWRIKMTEVSCKPATNAQEFLHQKWEECLEACEKMQSNHHLKFTHNELLRPLRRRLCEAVETAQLHWGLLEIEAALNGLRINNDKGKPYFRHYNLYSVLCERARKREREEVMKLA